MKLSELILCEQITESELRLLNVVPHTEYALFCFRAIFSYTGGEDSKARYFANIGFSVQLTKDSSVTKYFCATSQESMNQWIEAINKKRERPVFPASLPYYDSF